MTNLIETPEKPDPSLTFDQMGARIRHNEQQGFGGAVVIQPPANGGDPIAFLVLDETQDPVQFWTLVKSKIDQTISELSDSANKDPWGGRR